METTINGKSWDITYNNVQAMKNLFPEVFSEDKIDFEKLKMVLGGGGE